MKSQVSFSTLFNTLTSLLYSLRINEKPDLINSQSGTKIHKLRYSYNKSKKEKSQI